MKTVPAFEVHDDTLAHLVRFAAGQNMTLAEYLRSIAAEHVYGKLVYERGIAAAQKAVEELHGPL